LITATPARTARPAAVSASTVFAVALAIVAGLIFAWLFKMVLLDKKKTPPAPPPETYTMTVAATNLYDKMAIEPIHIKTIKVSKQELDAYKARRPGTALLTGNQPVGRVPKKSLKAEEPIYDDDLDPFSYPIPVSDKLAKGKKAVIVAVPAKAAMVQIDDVVDCYCTMANDAFGIGRTATALIAKNSRVLARFNTTRPGARPANPNAPRTYTLEVSPYRYALISLAQKMGARFSLAVTDHATSESLATQPTSTEDENEPSADRVTSRDLAKLFGIGPPKRRIGPWTIERYAGLRRQGIMRFPPGARPSRLMPPDQPDEDETPAAATPPAGTPAKGQDSGKPGATPAGTGDGSGVTLPPVTGKE
jgi:Flp pilus assembly protein CpaB